MLVLGIETSCDDTAVALVRSDHEILINEVFTNLTEHNLFGGIVPEIASRNHLEILPNLIIDKIGRARLGEIDAIAVTHAPGLIGGLIVGVMFAKSLSYSLGKPIIPVNHLEGHLLTNRLVYKQLQFPFLSLLVSGGHCQFIIAHDVGKYQVIGGTLDDAVGEAFDKVGRMLGFEYPGGPKIEAAAKRGNINAFKLPKPLLKDSTTCNLSFSGLKTAVKRLIESETVLKGRDLDDALRADFCASFQHTVSEILQSKLQIALKIAKKHGITNFAICGGVSANQYICNMLKNIVNKHGFEFYNAPLKLCVDNAAMIAWTGIENWKLHKFSKRAFQKYNFAPQSSLRI